MALCFLMFNVNDCVYASCRVRSQAVANDDFETADQLNESIAAAKADEDAKRAAVASAESTTLVLTRAAEALDAQLAALRASASAAEANADADAQALAQLQAQAQAEASSGCAGSASEFETNGEVARAPEAQPNAEAAAAAESMEPAPVSGSEFTFDATDTQAANTEDEVAASD